MKFLFILKAVSIIKLTSTNQRAYLNHILGDGIISEEVGALPGVEPLGVLEEDGLEGVLVDQQVLAAGRRLVLVQTQRYVAVDYLEITNHHQRLHHHLPSGGIGVKH